MEQSEEIVKENKLRREAEMIEIKTRIPLPLYLHIRQECRERTPEMETSTYFREAIERYAGTDDKRI